MLYIGVLCGPIVFDGYDVCSLLRVVQHTIIMTRVTFGSVDRDFFTTMLFIRSSGNSLRRLDYLTLN